MLNHLHVLLQLLHPVIKFKNKALYTLYFTNCQGDYKDGSIVKNFYKDHLPGYAVSKTSAGCPYS